MVTQRSGSGWTGWVVFAAAMMVMIGLFNVIEGLVVLVDDDRVVVAADRLVVVDLTGWGWTLLISGLLLVATGVGLFTARTWARVAAILLVALHAVSQVAWLGAYPVWSLLMLALDTVVLYALTARWAGASGDLDAFGPTAQGRIS